MMRLRLYVADSSPHSRRAVASVRAFALEAGTTAGEGDCLLEVVDVGSEPARADADRILATPTLLRVEPLPPRRIVGDMGRGDRLRALLGEPGEGA